MRWLMVDRILECEPGVSAVGIKTFPRSDLIFMDHFPGHPIVPGVLQVEMIAQLAGKCAVMARPEVRPVIGSIKGSKFYGQVNPGDLCVIRARIEKMAMSYIIASGEIEVDGHKVSSAEIFYGLIERNNFFTAPGEVNAQDCDAVIREFLDRKKAVSTLQAGRGP